MVSLIAKFCIKDRENISSPMVRQAYAKLCSSVGIFLNVILFVVKLLCGTISGSTAIITDGFNNLADAGTSFASFLGFCIAGIGAGENHLFGHGRYEWFMGLLYSIAVTIMGMTLAKNSFMSIISPKDLELNLLIFFILVCSIIVKLYMFFYNKDIARKIDSTAMKATAVDCISDIVATTAIVISLITEHFTGWAIDGWCGLLVSIFIMISGMKSMSEIVGRLLGKSPDKDTVNKINKIAMQYEEVQGINDLIVHDYGLGHFVISMHIEGKEGVSSDVLNDIANEISYKLYIDMGCNATIQTDFLVKDPMIVDEIFTRATKELQKIEPDASINNLRIIKSSLHTNVILVIAGSNNLQKIEPKIRDIMKDVVVSVDSSYHAIVKFMILRKHKKKGM